MSGGETALDQQRLKAIVQRADPAAVLVSQRILRRVIQREYSLSGPVLEVPHRKSIVIGRDALLRIVHPAELSIENASALPEVIFLLAEMDASRLASLPAAAVLRKYWRLLFHIHVHAELARRRIDGKLADADVRSRVARIGRSEIAAATAVLRQENLLLPPGDLAKVYEEFAALYLELRHFEPRLLPLYFPLARFQEIDDVLALDVDAHSLYARTRLEGAAEVASKEGPLLGGGPSAANNDATPNPQAFARLNAAAGQSRQRGNFVRAALRFERAARVGDALQKARARAEAREQLELLAKGLHKVLDAPATEMPLWRQVLGALVVPAAGGLWTVEGRLLYDLQKVCLDGEREVYAVDIVEWFVSGFRRPLRRHLPNQRHVAVLKHLRQAVRRLPGVRLPSELRAPFQEVLHAAVGRSEARIRDRFRPGARAALDFVGLSGQNRAERVSRAKIVEELLDRVVERDLLTMSDLRDAVARNRVKLPDLSGPGEFLSGDRLIRANRALARHLDGVYRRGEIYLRWLQRGTSAAFGTRVGRWLTRYVALPFGGAFILLEGYKAILHEITGHQQRHTHDTHWLAEHLTGEILPTVVLGFFLLGVLYVPKFRRLLLDAFGFARRVARAVFVDAPAFVIRIPIVRAILQSRAYALLYFLVLRPLFFAAPVSLGLYLADAPSEQVWGAGAAVLLSMSLLLNSPLGSHVEELFADRVVRGWELVRRDILPGIYYLLVTVFRLLMERLERLLYAVDEWLRFRTGDSQLSAIVKPAFGLVWFVATYFLRAVINLFVEPTFNPIKHIPVVTVAAKLLVPFIPTLAAAITAATQPILGLWLAGLLAAAILFFIPGFAGFLVWELKENWRLYAANQSLTLTPEIVGSHGETVRRLLRPGFHSGTVPKLFAKLRHADGKSARKQQEALHHVAEAVKRFTERDLIAVLENSRRWSETLRLVPGEISLGTNRLRIEVRCRQVVSPPLCIDIDEENGRLLAGISRSGWLAILACEQKQALADALAGFYQLAGVDLVREEIRAVLPPNTSFGVTDAGLSVWPAAGAGEVANYPLDAAEAAAQDASVLNGGRLVCSSRPVKWSDWVAVWEQDGVSGKRHVLESATLLLPEND
jgi:hypothetical protein